MSGFSRTDTFLRFQVDRVVSWMMPETYQKQALANLRGRNLPLLLFLLGGIGWAVWAVTVNIKPSFRLPGTAGVAAALLLSFGRGTPGLSLGLAVGTGVLAVVASKAHVHMVPKKAGRFYQGVHSSFCVGAIATGQIAAYVFDRKHVLPNDVLLRGLPAGIVMVSAVLIAGVMWRERRERLKNQPPPVLPWRVVRRITYMWAAAVIVILLANPLPELFPHEGAFPPYSLVLLALAVKSEMDVLGQALRGSRTISGDLEIKDIGKKIAKLPVQPKRQTRSRQAVILELLAFPLFGLSAITTVIGLALGVFPADQIDWFAWGSSVAGFFSAMLLWRVIRDMNQNLADALQQEIEDKSVK